MGQCVQQGPVIEKLMQYVYLHNIVAKGNVSCQIQLSMLLPQAAGQGEALVLSLARMRRTGDDQEHLRVRFGMAQG